MKNGVVKIGVCIVEGIIVYWFGGWDIWFSSLIALMLCDIIIGLIKSYLGNSEKSSNGRLSSQSRYVGGLKKVLILIIVSVANIIDTCFFGDDAYIRCAVVGFYIINEALSILENLALCGIQLPKFLLKTLDCLNDKVDNNNKE